MTQQTVFVAFLSPAGTTRTVGRAIAEAAESLGRKAVLLDLFRPEETSGLIKELKKGDVLFAGSPVYSQHALPQVMDFLAGLPERAGCFAAPFATYGTVSSGVALREMAAVLADKGTALLGGIKVPTLHSMLWTSAEPLGKGRPDSEDLALVKRFAARVLEKSGMPDCLALQVSQLDYQGEKVQEAARNSGIAHLKTLLPPHEVNTETCTQCGTCAESCPTANISLSPTPVFSDRCIFCFNCVRLCEPGALTNLATTVLEGEIHKRADFFAEPVEVKAFV
ncbi:MAG: 4Fe-4S binding protein [Thermodesulfobacteriota bacterium]